MVREVPADAQLIERDSLVPNVPSGGQVPDRISGLRKAHGGACDDIQDAPGVPHQDARGVASNPFTEVTGNAPGHLDRMTWRDNLTDLHPMIIEPLRRN